MRVFCPHACRTYARWLPMAGICDFASFIDQTRVSSSASVGLLPILQLTLKTCWVFKFAEQRENEPGVTKLVRLDRPRQSWGFPACEDRTAAVLFVSL